MDDILKILLVDLSIFIALDKRRYQVNICLTTP